MTCIGWSFRASSLYCRYLGLVMVQMSVSYFLLKLLNAPQKGEVPQEVRANELLGKAGRGIKSIQGKLIATNMSGEHNPLHIHTLVQLLELLCHLTHAIQPVNHFLHIGTRPFVRH